MPDEQFSVLVVDDDKGFCKLVASAFENYGVLAFMATDGDQAVALFKEKHPTVILLDLAMPGLNGFQVAEQIRLLEGADRHSMIVIMTAYTRNFTISQNFESSIDSYITKPVLPEEIVAHVAGLTR